MLRTAEFDISGDSGATILPTRLAVTSTPGNYTADRYGRISPKAAVFALSRCRHGFC